MRERDEDEASEPLVSCRPQTPPSHEEKLVNQVKFWGLVHNFVTV